MSHNTLANRCVIGYNLLPAYWNQGYATEIAKALICTAFAEWGVERVEALAMAANLASCKVLEKAGLEKEGILRRFTKVRGHY